MNNNVYTIITLLMAVYGSMASQPLPEWLRELADNPMFTFVFMVFIAYVGTMNVRNSLFIALSYLILMNVVDKYKIQEGFANMQMML